MMMSSFSSGGRKTSLHQSCIPVSMVDCYCNPPANMSSKKWSTVLEQICIHMICDAIRMEENNALRTMIDTSSDADDTSLCSLNESQ